jgi:hypothetical protein
MLVHMAPEEVSGLQALARAGGGTLTLNPDTGLPEANFLKRMLPMIIGAGITAATGGAAAPWMIGLGLGGAGLGGLMQMRGAGAAKRTRQDLAAMAAPYQQEGRTLMDQAKRGELSPASAQAYQAAQARIAQQASRTGGVGVVQATATLERLRSQLLTNQMNLGLRVANIGDQYMRGAIQTGMQADQALNQASTNFFTNLANTLAGPVVSSMSAATQAR